MRKSCAALALLFLMAGCVGLPRHVVKTRSESLPHPESTTLGRLVASEEANKNLSGIHLLSSGEEALADLIALADHAERTLDVQYYIIHQDDSARILLRHVRQAADRGVRVRVLVDDLNTVGEDRRFMHLSEHANVEVRVFNPFPGGRFATWTRFVASASDMRRINHRMHNKLFVADNALAITGGRNIGMNISRAIRTTISSTSMSLRAEPSCRNYRRRSMPFGTAGTHSRLPRWPRQ